jgi:hypothetical protein
VKNGFLCLTSHADLLQQSDLPSAVVVETASSCALLHSLACVLTAAGHLHSGRLEECKEMAARVTDTKWKVFADILAGEIEKECE